MYTCVWMQLCVRASYSWMNKCMCMDVRKLTNMCACLKAQVQTRRRGVRYAFSVIEISQTYLNMIG